MTYMEQRSYCNLLQKSYRGKNSERTYAIKDEGNNLFTQPKDISAQWGEYFSDLLTFENRLERSCECVQSSEDIPVKQEQEHLITIDEVRNSIKKMKKEKLPGDDGLPEEIVKAGGECE